MAWASARAAHRHRYDHHRCNLADSLTRILLITRRRVTASRSAVYARLWRDLHDVAGVNRANAWIFTSTADPESYTEFIEWQSAESDSIIEKSDVASAWSALNSEFPYEESNTWKAANF